MEFKAFSIKGGSILLAAVLCAIGIPLLIITQWHIFKYLLPLLIGAFFFLTVNKFNIGNSYGATITSTLVAWVVPLVGIPGIHEGLFAWLIYDGEYGLPWVAFILYSLPAFTGLLFLLRGKKVLPY